MGTIYKETNKTSGLQEALSKSGFHMTFLALLDSIILTYSLVVFQPQPYFIFKFVHLKAIGGY